MISALRFEVFVASADCGWLSVTVFSPPISRLFSTAENPGAEDSVFWDSLQAQTERQRNQIQVCKRSHRKKLITAAHSWDTGPLPVLNRRRRRVPAKSVGRNAIVPCQSLAPFLTSTSRQVQLSMNSALDTRNVSAYTSMKQLAGEFLGGLPHSDLYTTFCYLATTQGRQNRRSVVNALMAFFSRSELSSSRSRLSTWRRPRPKAPLP